MAIAIVGSLLWNAIRGLVCVERHCGREYAVVRSSLAPIAEAVLVSVVVAMALSWTLARTTSRIPEAWRSVLRRQWSILAALSAVAILVSIILLRESFRATGEKSAYSAEVLCILLALMLWMVQWVVQALRASWNVARLEDRWKELYVYAAEACLVMGLGLAYAQFSEWFELPFREYWPIGLLLVAVASQGVATMVRRAGIWPSVTRLQNTSLVLPLLASMGCSVHSGGCQGRRGLLVVGVLLLCDGSSRWLATICSLGSYLCQYRVGTFLEPHSLARFCGASSAVGDSTSGLGSGSHACLSKSMEGGSHHLDSISCRFDDLHELDVRSADRRLWQAVVATDDLDGPERPDGILGDGASSAIVSLQWSPVPIGFGDFHGCPRPAKPTAYLALVGLGDFTWNGHSRSLRSL